MKRPHLDTPMPDRRQRHPSPPLRLTFVLRSFLDYRVPVFAALDAMVGHHLHVIYPEAHSPARARAKLAGALGHRAIQLSGERNIGKNRPSREFANASWCVPYQPGLLRAIARTRPDVVIGDGFFAWTVAALAYRILRKVGLVVCYERTFHTERSAQWYRRGYRRLAMRWIDAMCCNGRLSFEYAASLGMSPERITTGFMAADTAGLTAAVAAVDNARKRELRQRLGIQGTCFLYVGQLIARKGVRELLAGWQRLNAAGRPDATLLLVGDGNQRAELEHFAARNSLPGVRFAGPIDYDDMASFYATADVAVMPTLEDNWSLVVPEAMACGLPVLCSKFNGGWPELVASGVNGWVFNPHDAEDLVRVLREAIEHHEELDDMGNRSREIAGAFTPKHAAAAILAACRMAAARRCGPNVVPAGRKLRASSTTAQRPHLGTKDTSLAPP